MPVAAPDCLLAVVVPVLGVRLWLLLLPLPVDEPPPAAVLLIPLPPEPVLVLLEPVLEPVLEERAVPESLVVPASVAPVPAPPVEREVDDPCPSCDPLCDPPVGLFCDMLFSP